MHSASVDISNKRTQDHLQQLAGEVMAEISELDPSHSKELLGVFVSELFLAVAKQEQRDFRRQKQAEGIAAAKARGVRFGPARKPLPDKFEECYEAWENGQLTQTQAAKICGMSRESFRRTASRRKQSNTCSVLEREAVHSAEEGERM